MANTSHRANISTRNAIVYISSNMFPSGDMLRQVLSYTQDHLFIAPVCREFRDACPSAATQYRSIASAAMVDYAAADGDVDYNVLALYLAKNGHLEALQRARELFFNLDGVWLDTLPAVLNAVRSSIA